MTILKVNYETSTVEFGGRSWPAVGLICPPVPGVDEPESERCLGGPGGGTKVFPQLAFDVYIPLENGLLVHLSVYEGDHSFEQVTLHARTCELSSVQAEPVYLPIWIKPDMEPAAPGVHYWRGCEVGWTVELLDRVAKRRFYQPQGPAVRLVSLLELLRIEGRPDPEPIGGPL